MKAMRAERAMSGSTGYNLFINGTWRSGSDGAYLPLVNPAVERVFGKVASASESDIEEALSSAKHSLDAWSSKPARERGALLVSAAHILQKKTAAAAQALSCEQGKTIAEAQGEYARAVETLAWNG